MGSVLCLCTMLNCCDFIGFVWIATKGQQLDISIYSVAMEMTAWQPLHNGFRVVSYTRHRCNYVALGIDATSQVMVRCNLGCYGLTIGHHRHWISTDNGLWQTIGNNGQWQIHCYNWIKTATADIVVVNTDGIEMLCKSIDNQVYMVAM
jgi:hypothetical protein